jgi:hypothetical protein
VAADVNNDGKLDLICANFSAATLTVLTNNGRGVFGSNATLNVSTGPGCVVAADVNGDGKLDLVCVSGGEMGPPPGEAGTLTVLTNNGSGSFGSNATYTVGSDPVCVVAADVNNDGKLDLITANQNSGTLTVLTNNGSGGFGFNATLPAGIKPSCVIAADINGDGKLDLISANLGNVSGSTLTVLTNNGSGGFGSNATLYAGSEPISVVAADVNNDGKLDLICANAGVAPLKVAYTLTLLTQIPGPPPLTAFAPSIFNVGSQPVCVVAADVNNDGKLDLICANQIDNTLTVLTNNGSGGFGSNATLYAFGPLYVVAADVNGDGKVDLITANYGLPNMPANSLTVLTNNGSGGFGSNATYTVGNGPVCVVAADVNNDGKLDLITANADATLTVLTNNGSGGFGSNATLNVGNGARCVVAADVNGDGKLDLICANEDDNTLTVLTNNGSGGFGSNATYTVGNAPVCVVAADVNNDGKLDLICANEDDNTLTVLTNNGSGGFGSYATLNVGIGPVCVVAADVNNDGKLDLICGYYGNGIGNTLTVLTQTIVGPPTLTVASIGSNTFVISWSSFSTGFALQTNSDLTTTNWGPSGYNISTTNGTNESATITPLPGNLFFRLSNP